MNRIAVAVANRKKQIEDRVASGLTTKKRVAECNRALDMEFDEYVKFQELKTLAVAHNKLTLDEGMTIYEYLGNTPSVFNGRPVHVKATLTDLFKELLQWTVRMKGGAVNVSS